MDEKKQKKLIFYGVLLALCVSFGPVYLIDNAASVSDVDQKTKDEAWALQEQINKQNLDNPGLGGITAAQTEEIRNTVAKEPVAFSGQSSLLGRAVELGPVDNLYHAYKRWKMPVDPDFKLDDHWDIIEKNIEPDDWHEFQGVRSTAEMNDLIQDVRREEEDRIYLHYAGDNGTLAQCMATALNPFILAALLCGILILNKIILRIPGKLGLGRAKTRESDISF